MRTIIDGRAEAWAFRWHEVCKPCRYIVTIAAAPDDSFSINFDAVVDDFGNLVRVPS